MAAAKRKPVGKKPPVPMKIPATIDPGTGIDLARVQPPVVDEYLKALGLGTKGTALERVAPPELAITAPQAPRGRAACGPKTMKTTEPGPQLGLRGIL